MEYLTETEVTPYRWTNYPKSCLIDLFRGKDLIQTTLGLEVSSWVMCVTVKCEHTDEQGVECKQRKPRVRGTTLDCLGEFYFMKIHQSIFLMHLHNATSIMWVCPHSVAQMEVCVTRMLFPLRWLCNPGFRRIPEFISLSVFILHSVWDGFVLRRQVLLMLGKCTSLYSRGGPKWQFNFEHVTKLVHKPQRHPGLTFLWK